MIVVPSGAQVWLAAGMSGIRRGLIGLSTLVQTTLADNPYGGNVFFFPGRRGDPIKSFWWDRRAGLCLFAKRLERGRFVWPRAEQHRPWPRTPSRSARRRQRRKPNPSAVRYRKTGRARPSVASRNRRPAPTAVAPCGCRAKLRSPQKSTSSPNRHRKPGCRLLLKAVARVAGH